MARKVGQIVGRGPRNWLVRVYNGRNPETKKRNSLNQTIHRGLRDAQAHLNKMLGERDRGPRPFHWQRESPQKSSASNLDTPA